MKWFTILLGGAVLAGLSSCADSPDLFEVTDANDDGRLSNEELEDTLVKGVFENTDTNDDGVVSFEEWKTSNPDDPSSLFEERDADGDGQVTMAEMQSYAEKKDLFGPVVRDFDADRNGFISEGEAEAVRKRYHIINAR
ncbi:MAG: hypothetical protein AAGI48_10145 [Verrucomicrobiota bacterium]